MRIFPAALTVAALLLGSTAIAAEATREENIAKCSDANLDVSIAGCSALLQASGESNEARATAFNNRGVAYRDKADYDKALQDFDEALKLAPSDVGTLVHRGRAYRGKGDHARALADFDAAIKADPKGANAFTQRGLAFADKGDVPRAIADFDQAIALNPNAVDALYNRGVTLLDRGEIDNATAVISLQWLALHRDDVRARWS